MKQYLMLLINYTILLKKKKFNFFFFGKIKFEFNNLKKLNHPSIIKVKQLFIDWFIGKVYTIMELVEAPEMFITI